MGFYQEDKFKKISIIVILFFITMIALYYISNTNKKSHSQNLDSNQNENTLAQTDTSALPTLIYPPNNQAFPSHNNQAEITFVGQHSEAIFLQIASDKNFTDIIHQKIPFDRDRVKVALSTGTYYWRLRSGNENNPWTEAQSISVLQSQLHLPSSAYELQITATLPIIPKNKAEMKHDIYLNEIGFLKNLFSTVPREIGSTIEVQDLNTQKIYSLNQNAWPIQLMEAGMHKYRYRFTKENFTSSPWSTPKSLQIYLRPPQPKNTFIRKDILADYLEKISQKLRWEPTLLTRFYELQISTNKEFSQPVSIISSKPRNYVGIYPNKQYYWRVRALNQKKKALSNYSRISSLYISSQDTNIYLSLNSEPMAPVAKTTELVREPAAQTPMKLQLPEKQSEIVSIADTGEAFLKELWAWVGTGLNSVTYSQSLNGDSNLNYSSASQANYMVNVGLMTSVNFGVDVSYKTSPSTIKDPQNNIASTKDYNWSTLAADLLYRIPWSFNIFGQPTSTTLRAGAQQHQLPYLSLTSLDTLNLLENDLLLASVGLELERDAGAWKYSVMIRYQDPLSSTLKSASTFDLKSKLFFDSSLGVSYAFYRNYRLGLFMYGQWLKYDFSYSDPSISNFGTEDLFFSTIDLRFGFNF